jgi:hypothetical protein
MRQQLAGPLALALASFAVAGCAAGPSVTGSFDRTLTVTAPIRLELANAAGDVSITGSGDNRVHVHAQVRSSGMGFGNPQQRLDEVVNNPPIEQSALAKISAAHTTFRSPTSLKFRTTRRSMRRLLPERRPSSTCAGP